MVRISHILISLLIVTSFVGCSSFKYFKVAPKRESFPVPNDGDAADDAAIYVDQKDYTKSLILVTDKRSGIAIYNLKGGERSYIKLGRMNNIDIRSNVKLLGRKLNIVAVSNKTTDRILLYHLDPSTAKLIEITGKSSEIDGGIYGLCLYRHSSSKTTYAIATSKDGTIEMFKLTPGENGKIDLLKYKNFQLNSTVEGCAGDDITGMLYLAEESKGLWKYPIHGNSLPILIADKSANYFSGDIEGVTIYAGPSGQGQIVVSSQGNSSFAMFNRKNDKYIGSFKIVSGNGIDGVSYTDGIASTSAPLGEAFPYGLFVAQDNVNTGVEGKENQNFKFISWEDIATNSPSPIYLMMKEIN